MTTTFAELGLNEQILAGVKALGFTTPTPVQAEAIPLVLEGRDVVASAQTGTGKTAAFALPTLQRIAALARDAEQEAAAEKTAGASAETGGGAPTEAHAEAQAEKADVAQAETGGGASAEASAAAADAASAAPDSTVAPTDGSTTPAADSEGRPRRRRRRRRRKKRGSQDTPQGASSSGGGATPAALIVTPTRELAQQIEDVAGAVCRSTGQRAVIVMGGARLNQQIKELERGCDLLVATPGRLLDLMEHRHVSLAGVRVFVLDEADRMLDMGFWPSVRRIMAALPKKRQNLLFSATIPPSIKATVDTMLDDPAIVEISHIGETAETVDEHLCAVTQGQKAQLLEALVRSMAPRPERVLVFCRTKQRVDSVSATLKKAGFDVGVMHSDRPQKARERALANFRAAKLQVLVATDVMSRGIDVSGIDAVVNYDVPLDPEDYVHRIGRTGRAGTAGQAYTFVAPDEISPFREIEYFTGKLVPTWDLEGFSYDEGRIVPNAHRSPIKPKRSMFSGSRSRGRGPNGGRYGRHY